MSAREESGGMNEVIPALIAGGAPYFGKNLPNVESVEATPRAIPPGSGTSELRVSPESLRLDSQFIDGLLKEERDKFSGAGAASQS